MIRSLLCAAVLIPAAFGAVAANAKDGEAPQLHLSYANVDFNDSTQVDRLYDLIKITAGEVCDSGAPVSAVGVKRLDRACKATAVANAVRQINQPRLTELASLDSRDAPALAMNVTMDKRAR